MRLLKRVLLLLSVIFIFIFNQACKPDGQTCHRGDPDDPKYCDQYRHGSVAIVLSPTEVEMLMQSNIVIELIHPEWIKYDHIGDPTEIILGAVDKSEKVITELINLKPNKNVIGNKIQLELKLNYLQREFIQKFLDNVKEESKISISIGMNLGTMSLYSKESYVYENFQVSINLYVNGNLYLSQQFYTNIAYLMVGYLRSTFKEIPDNAFSGNPDAIRNAMLNKLDALENMINAKNPQGAYQKLKNDIMSKFDGQNGGNPQDDWVSDPYYSSATYSFYKKILNLLDYLKS